MAGPFKMKGSPMARNFGAPFKKDTKPTLPTSSSDNTSVVSSDAASQKFAVEDYQTRYNVWKKRMKSQGRWDPMKTHGGHQNYPGAGVDEKVLNTVRTGDTR